MKKVHTLVRYLEICDGNMQEGSFRCDANVSVRKIGAEKFGTRAEIKNLNSFRFVEKAINYEVERQIDLLEGGGKVVQETRLYDPDKGETRSHALARKKRTTTATSPIRTCCRWSSTRRSSTACKATLPELPDQKAARFASQYGLSEYDAGVLTASRGAGGVLRRRRRWRRQVPSRTGQARRQLGGGRSLAAALNKHNLEIGGEPHRRRAPRGPAGAHRRQHHLRQDRQGSVRGDVGGRQRRRRHHRGEGPEADHRHAARSRRPSTRSWRRIPGQLADYRSGKDKLFGFFVGQVMKATRRQGQSGAAQRAAEEEARRLMDAVSDSDLVRRFVLERHPIRGHAVRLSDAWLEPARAPGLSTGRAATAR